MKALRIQLHSANDVKEFVACVQKYPFDIKLKNDSYEVDGKSVLGLFSLNLNSPLDMEVHSNNCDDFISEIEKFQV